MARATSSLPVPVSPVIRTVLRVQETSAMRRIRSSIARLRPTMPYRSTLMTLLLDLQNDAAGAPAAARGVRASARRGCGGGDLLRLSTPLQLGVYGATKPLPRTPEARHHRAERYAQRFGQLTVGHAFELPEGQHVAGAI